MFLTHMPLNPERRSTRDLMQSPQRLHAAVLAVFPPGSRETGRILWRLDHPERHRLDLYLVSHMAPSLESMADQAGWSTQPVWRTTDYGPFLRRLADGQRWVFRLRANPIRSVTRDVGKRGQRVALPRAADQLAWLVHRGGKYGFEVVDGENGPNVRVTEQRTERFRRGGPETKLVTLNTAAFEGVLEVTDAELLRNALSQGVGSAKAYGCGLMTLAALP